MKKTISLVADRKAVLSPAQTLEFLGKSLDPADYNDQRVLIIIPDSTRSGPFHLLVRQILTVLKPLAAEIDILIALGTHPLMSRPQIAKFLKISPADKKNLYRGVTVFNHEWNKKSALRKIGELDPKTICRLTRNLFCETVPVEVNKRIFDYDRIVVLGPVFPHEVVGFSGGWKYFFPGICGPEFLNFFHWLGAVITNVKVIGVAETPVRAVIHKAARLISKPCQLLALDVHDGEVSAIYSGDMVKAWRMAAARAGKTHVVRLKKRYKTVLGVAPELYDDLWTAGKVMYKLESVVADGGELIIYAPHVREVSYTHGRVIDRIGYHVRDYFLKQMGRFKGVPRGVMAHSTHVRGTGTFENGVERPRISVTLATSIPESRCRKIALGYRNWKTVDVPAYEGKEKEGILVVRNAGEVLFRA